MRSGRQLGWTLGLVHRAFRDPAILNAPGLAWLPGDVPWVMRIHEPEPQIRATISRANCEMLRILQLDRRLCESLDRCRDAWLPDTTIHGDVRFDNVLVISADTPPPSGVTIRLVDWELVQRGDAAWDIAGVFQDTVFFWISGMSLAEDMGEMIASATFSLGVLQSFLRFFWQGYLQAAGLKSDAANATLLRSVTFSGARLIQTAYGMSQAADTMPARSVILLQLSRQSAR